MSQLPSAKHPQKTPLALHVSAQGPRLDPALCPCATMRLVTAQGTSTLTPVHGSHKLSTIPSPWPCPTSVLFRGTFGPFLTLFPTHVLPHLKPVRAEELLHHILEGDLAPGRLQFDL